MHKRYPLKPILYRIERIKKTKKKVNINMPRKWLHNIFTNAVLMLQVPVTKRPVLIGIVNNQDLSYLMLPK